MGFYINGSTWFNDRADLGRYVESQLARINYRQDENNGNAQSEHYTVTKHNGRYYFNLKVKEEASLECSCFGFLGPIIDYVSNIFDRLLGRDFQRVKATQELLDCTHAFLKGGIEEFKAIDENIKALESEIEEKNNRKTDDNLSEHDAIDAEVAQLQGQLAEAQAKIDSKRVELQTFCNNHKGIVQDLVHSIDVKLNTVFMRILSFLPGCQSRLDLDMTRYPFFEGTVFRNELSNEIKDFDLVMRNKTPNVLPFETGAVNLAQVKYSDHAYAEFRIMGIPYPEDDHKYGITIKHNGETIHEHSTSYSDSDTYNLSAQLSATVANLPHKEEVEVTLWDQFTDGDEQKTLSSQPLTIRLNAFRAVYKITMVHDFVDADQEAPKPVLSKVKPLDKPEEIEVAVGMVHVGGSKEFDGVPIDAALAVLQFSVDAKGNVVISQAGKLNDCEERGLNLENASDDQNLMLSFTLRSADAKGHSVHHQIIPAKSTVTISSDDLRSLYLQGRGKGHEADEIVFGEIALTKIKKR